MLFYSPRQKPLLLFFLLAPVVFFVAISARNDALMGAKQVGEVNIYSYRQSFLVKALFKSFSDKTGLKINVIFAKKGLIERIAAEGRNSPADLLLTSDIGRLTEAVRRKITQKVNSPVLEKNIPPALRDSQGHWFGLTQRARVVYASKSRVRQNEITYEELGSPKWKGKICMRSGQHVYNIALIASMIAAHGVEETEKWLSHLKANLARKPSGNDRLQIKAIYAGQCDLAIANTYYMAKMVLNDKNPEQKEWAASVKILFPNSNQRGTHVNISGMVLAKYAPHKKNAIQLMEYLSGDQAQQIYARANHEYPVKEGVPWSELVRSWGTFKAQSVSLDDIASLRAKASELVDKTGFDKGPNF